MFDSFELAGKWWIPEAPRKKVTGTLHFDEEESISIKLVDSLVDHDFMRSRLDEREVILGHTTDGTRITLIDCFETSHRTSSNGIPTSTYLANTVIKGIYVRKKDELKSRKALARFSYLDKWLCLNGFQILHFDLDGVDIKYQRPERITVQIDDETTLVSDTEVLGPNLGPFINEVRVQQKAYLGIEQADVCEWQTLLRSLSHAKDLIAFAAQRPASYSKVRVWPEKTSRESGPGRTGESVELYFRQIHPRKAEKEITHLDMLFSLHSMQDNEQEAHLVIRRWFGLVNQIKPVLDLYFSVLCDPGMYLQQRFLVLSQALESYGRLTTSNAVIPKNQHQQRIRSIVEAVPTDYKKWLKSRLQNSNEPSFLKRIEDIADRFKEPIGLVVDDIPGFTRRIRDVRNDLTHPGQRMFEPTTDELARLISQMQHILTILILSNLGYDSNMIVNLIRTKRVHGFFRVHGEA